jgi:nucleotide-binding universal stress UspA family protein
MLPVRTVLHPTDFSDSSDTAFRLACSLARDYGARLVVLHVAPLPLAVSAEGVLVLPAELDLEALGERLHELRPDGPTVRVEYRLLQGDAAAEVLRVAKEIRSDLIVMGTHGRTGLGRLVMGSVAEQVVRKAACPVLTVKTPQGRAAPSERPVAAAAGNEAAASC